MSIECVKDGLLAYALCLLRLGSSEMRHIVLIVRCSIDQSIDRVVIVGMLQTVLERLCSV